VTTRSPDAIHAVAHEVHRLTIAVGADFDEFRARYERAVPPLDAHRLASLQAADADWRAILRAAADNAPHGFIAYWSSDVGSLMRLAGNSRRCVEYLMGNHTIAERMYRHDPAIMLYAPLRTVIYDDAAGTTWFAIDQPSTRFASFGTAAITAVGIELDRRVAALLDILDAPVPLALTGGDPTP
jgi:uncharacterized protein DUF302